MDEHDGLLDLALSTLPELDPSNHCRTVHARIIARLMAAHLDCKLATGVTPRAGSALAVHALRLESDGERHAVARSLRRAAVTAEGGGRLRPPGLWLPVPFNRRQVAAAKDTIDAITLRLHSPHRVHARGMARLRRIIADGCGPLYARGRGDLAGRLRAALAAL